MVKFVYEGNALKPQSPTTFVATTKQGVQSSKYCGPDGEGESYGFPALGVIEDHTKNVALGSELGALREAWSSAMCIAEEMLATSTRIETNNLLSERVAVN